MRPTRAALATKRILLAIALWLAPMQVFADARTDYMVRMLRTSSSFRVRVQAALSLGRIGANERPALRALIGSLKDDHPAVRTAAAAALEQLGDPAALQALGGAERDADSTVRRAARQAVSALRRVAARRARPEPPTPAPSVADRYYVSVAVPGSAGADLSRKEREALRSVVARQVEQLEGVVLAPMRENRRSAQRVLRDKDLIGFSIESSVVRVEQRSNGTRAEVSVILNTYPDRNVRAILNGAATVPGAGGVEATRRAIEGAYVGATRQLPSAFARERANMLVLSSPN